LIKIDQDAQYIGNDLAIQTLRSVSGILKGKPMKSAFAVLPAVFLATACSILMPTPVNVGDTESQLIAKRGQPSHRYQEGQQQLLEYATNPWGQKTYMARIGPDGKVISYEQVLTVQKFNSIKVGEATKEDVLRLIGSPSETAYFSRTDLEVWSYPYKESDVWNSLMHVHFDRNGIVRKMLNGPDPRFDPDMRFPFGMFGR
jgi:hypothetical protein